MRGGGELVDSGERVIFAVVMKTSILICAVVAAALSACGGKAADTTAIPKSEKTVEFNADSAYNYIARQVAMGPRVPGSEGHARCHGWITEQLSAMGATVELHDTVWQSPNGSKVEVRNIIGRINPDAPRQVMLAAHYDTRPWADRDADPKNHNTAIDGANDGGSGVAVILEILRNYPKDSKVGLTMLFLDQEDSGSYEGDDREWCLGSQAYAASLTPADSRPDYGFLLDIVGGRDAVFPREYFSEMMAPAVNNRLWAAAAAVGETSRFPDRIGGAVNDDHLYLLEAGIPIIDIIESQHPATGSFNPTWHTLDDNLENIDRATLRSVGVTVTHAIYR